MSDANSTEPAEIQLIDTHAHLFSEDFKDDREDMIRRAQEAGIKKMVMPNVDHGTIDAMLDVEARHTGWC